MNAGSVDEIVFTRNATSAINLVANVLGQKEIGEGDEIVLSIMEHHANIVPWHFLRERQGAVLKWLPMSDRGELLISELDRMITKKTKIVAITHMSNVLGTVNPVKDIIRIAHAKGVPVLVDGSQAVVHMPVDVRDLDADFYVFTGHKTYGPTGIGVLYAKKHHLDALPPYEGGGDMIETVAVDRVTYNKAPHKFEAGTPAIVEAIGLGAALNYMMQVGRDKIARHEADLASYAHERLVRLAVAETARHCTGQRRDFLVYDRWPAPARRLDHYRPFGRCNPRRASLRATANGAPRRHRHMPRLICHV